MWLTLLSYSLISCRLYIEISEYESNVYLLYYLLYYLLFIYKYFIFNKSYIKLNNIGIIYLKIGIIIIIYLHIFIMWIIDFCFINSFSNEYVKSRDYVTNMDSADFEYLSTNSPSWYSLLAMIESLEKKNDICDISSYIVLNNNKKTFTVRIKINNIINYIEESVTLVNIHNNSDDIKIIENLSKNIIIYLSKIYKDKYKSRNNKKQMFIFNSCAVYPIENFYLLFSEHYTTTPRLWIRRNTNNTRRKRNNSSPPDYSHTN